MAVRHNTYSGVLVLCTTRNTIETPSGEVAVPTFYRKQTPSSRRKIRCVSFLSLQFCDVDFLAPRGPVPIRGFGTQFAASGGLRFAELMNLCCLVEVGFNTVFRVILQYCSTNQRVVESRMSTRCALVPCYPAAQQRARVQDAPNNPNPMTTVNVLLKLVLEYRYSILPVS